MNTICPGIPTFSEFCRALHDAIRQGPSSRASLMLSFWRMFAHAACQGLVPGDQCGIISSNLYPGGVFGR